MKFSILSLVGACGLMVGCLEKGDDQTHQQAAIKLIEGVAAYQDIHNNLETNTEASKEAFKRFVNAPIAGAILLGEPVQFPSEQRQAVTQALTIALGQVPSCLNKTGDFCNGSFNTAPGECELSSDFKFSGTATQMCNDCKPTMGCTYGWNLDVTAKLGPMSLKLKTIAANVFVGPAQLMMASGFKFALLDASSKPPVDMMADICVASCGPITFSPTCGNNKSPTSGTVIVTALTRGNAQMAPIPFGKCVRLKVTGCNTVAVEEACACLDGTTPKCPAQTLGL
jgi:hypothetical protein